MKKYFDGLKFGMLLQLAIGPVCLMVFNTAKNTGFLNAFSLVTAVALVDAFYIILACLGASKLLEKENVKKSAKAVGALILVIFGVNIMFGAFDISFIPGLSIQTDAKSIFIQGLILTLSNPLTIAFWGSLLTAKIIEDSMQKIDLTVFSAGLVSATLFFLTGVAALGSVLNSFITEAVSKSLNVIVGVVIAYFGIKMYLKKS